jgi:prevent-host-death family protein
MSFCFKRSDATHTTSLSTSCIEGHCSTVGSFQRHRRTIFLIAPHTARIRATRPYCTLELCTTCPTCTRTAGMAKLNVSKARSDFSAIVNEAAFGRKRTVISRRGKEEVAAVIPIADLHLLERLAKAEIDRQDIADSNAARKNGGFKSLDDFAAETGW